MLTVWAVMGYLAVVAIIVVIIGFDRPSTLRSHRHRR